jgi:hypothetical protein
MLILVTKMRESGLVSPEFLAISLRDRALKNRRLSAFKATFCPSKFFMLGAFCCGNAERKPPQYMF